MREAADPPRFDPPTDVLFAAAFAPELASFDPPLASVGEGRIGNVRVAARTVGVGLVASAAGAAATLVRRRVRAVVLLGTCGAYPGSNLAIDQVVVSRVITLVDPAVLAGSMHFPGPMQTRIDSHGPLGDALAQCGAQPADVATTLAVTVDDAAAGHIGQVSGASVEHLEAFAVAIACANANVPFAALLGVANTVGSRGRDEWRVHHSSAAARAVRIAVRWIEDGAGGLPNEHR